MLWQSFLQVEKLNDSNYLIIFNITFFIKIFKSYMITELSPNYDTALFLMGMMSVSVVITAIVKNINQ